MASSSDMDYGERARFLISLQLPSRCGYLLTDELVSEGAELLRRGQSFEVLIEEKSVGSGFDAARGETIGDLPGVSARGISAAGLVRLVPKERGDKHGD